jgi:hypothetical protein
MKEYKILEYPKAATKASSRAGPGHRGQYTSSAVVALPLNKFMTMQPCSWWLSA